MITKLKTKYFDITYVKTKYTNGSNPYLEIQRYNLWNNIIDKFYKFLKSKNIKLVSKNKKEKDILQNNLSVWISLNQMKRTETYDPFFPYKAKYNDGLVKNLIDNAKLSESKAIKTMKEFNLPKLCNEACDEIKEYESKKQNYKIYKKEDYIIYKSEDEMVEVLCPGHIYKKLKKSFNEDMKYFLEKVFCVMLRYETLSGKSHQFAMETKFKDALRKEYNVNIELFGSPINFYYDYFGSLFYDTDKYFGSLGSFYNININEGFIIANPPYEELLLDKMVQKFIKNIKKENKPISISFGLPKWGKYRKFDAIELTKNSKYTKFYRCMNREVFWYDTFTKKRMIIPEHCRTVIQNSKGEIKFNLNKFNNLINNFWLK